MPKRKDINNILLIGSGPIVIGQGCEFDYSGVQACRSLKEEGYRVVVINSNPASIMTDPDLADRTYIEPITASSIKAIILKENIDSIITTMGGQTAINITMELKGEGFLDQHNIVLLGASVDVLRRAEDRGAFYGLLTANAIDCPRGFSVSSKEEALIAAEKIGFPLIVRSSFSLGGTGVSFVDEKESFFSLMETAFSSDLDATVLIEESVKGWKEFELEVVRDPADNCILVCSIENCDPMGVHTGDSITVAPALTLTDKQLQMMRSIAFKVMRVVGVETGGANVQFAMNPLTGRIVVIEMNPRVSRSSALASKATGYPIARVAAKLAVGYTLDELQNDMVGGQSAAYEPSMDYIITKMPRFDFNKLSHATHALGTSMKSVGEVMGIGKNFEESLLKAICSLEKGYTGLVRMSDDEGINEIFAAPSEHTVFYVADALRAGWSIKEVAEATSWDSWFLERIQNIVTLENRIERMGSSVVHDSQLLRESKALGISNVRISELTGLGEAKVRNALKGYGILPVYRRIDSCSAEFETNTAYLYSTYHQNKSSLECCESFPAAQKKVIIIGSGPNHIGQGLEFDYSCVYAAHATKKLGYQAIMVNCNPETVSTDHTTSDKLYFSPLTDEYILDLIEKEAERGELLGVILQCGGRASLKLAETLERSKIHILGASWDGIHHTENQESMKSLVRRFKNLRQPQSYVCNTEDEFVLAVQAIQGPVILRASHIIGGTHMTIISEKGTDSLKDKRARTGITPPLIVEKFLLGAKEFDVDAITDGNHIHIIGVLEHIEAAGVHSGDSRCVFPSSSLEGRFINQITEFFQHLVSSLGLKGFINGQFAVYENELYLIEVNPRASRTVPFLSKVLACNFSQIGNEIALGRKLDHYSSTLRSLVENSAIKYPVYSCIGQTNKNSRYSPQMKSTGEAMSWGGNLLDAYSKQNRERVFALLGKTKYVAIDIKMPQEYVLFYKSFMNRLDKKVYLFSREEKEDHFLNDVEEGSCSVIFSNDPSEIFNHHSNVESLLVCNLDEMRWLRQMLENSESSIPINAIQDMSC